MKYWAFIFLAVASITAVFGFGGIAGASAGIAQILFMVFVALLAAVLLAQALRDNTRR